MNKKFRIEKDSLGKVEIASDNLWGAQTQRALNNFPRSDDLMPLEIIHALAIIKKSAAIANYQIGLLGQTKADLIIKAASEIIDGLYDKNFPLPIWQSGSGTQTNMNLNEVISNLASQYSDQSIGSHQPLHPNDDVNMSQSTNDTFPSAIHIAVIQLINKLLLPELNSLTNLLERKSEEWQKIIKIGRTHLQDAIPMTLSQEVLAWQEQIESCKSNISRSIENLFVLPIGGTAIGTGLNSPPSFDEKTVLAISQITNLPFRNTFNKFSLMSMHNHLSDLMNNLKLLACTLLKISNDIRLLSSGPRAGLAELELPSNEPGSSIMPGKINPTQCESLSMICIQIMGYENAVSFANSGGHLQMNVYKPLIGSNIIKTITLLSESLNSFRTKMLIGIKPNINNIEKNLNNSLMLITAFVPHIGYEKSSEIALLAYKKGWDLKQAGLKLGYIKEGDFERIINFNKMTNQK